MARLSEDSSEVPALGARGTGDPALAERAQSREGVDRESVVVRRQVAHSALLAGRRWRFTARWVGLAIFVVGASLLAWVFWQAMTGFQNFAQPGYLSSRMNTVSGDNIPAQIQAVVVTFGTELLRVLYLILLGYLASVIAGKGIQFFSASEAVIDEAVVADVE